MKRFEVLSRPFKVLAFTAVFAAAFGNHANAERIFYDSFEVVDPAGYPVGWQRVGHPNYISAPKEDSTWQTPYDERGMSTYGAGIATKDYGFIPEESGEYILKFNISSTASKGEYRAEIVTQEAILGDLLPEALVASATGDTNGSKDMSFSGEIRWRYDPVPDPVLGEILQTKLLIKLMQDPLRADWRNTPIWDNVSVDWIPDVDSTGPTVLDIADDNGGATVVATNSLVTYTVTFNEPMNASTVNPSDFGNAGGADVTIESVTPTANAAVFLVEAKPTSQGTLRLEIVELTDLKDAVGNSMDTEFVVIQDNMTFQVESGTPILQNIVDNKAGAPVAVNTLVTYTLTFSEDMNAATVSAADFGNAGTAPITIGTTITETTPGVFTVPVTPTGSGTLRFQVKPGVDIKAADSGILTTNPSGITDETTITVDGTPPLLTEITDDADGGSVTVGTLVTYDVFFSEDMDDSTVTAADFGNTVVVGNAPFTINSVEEASPGVFRIELTPTGTGTIQLRVNAGAVLTDAPGNALVITPAIIDDTILTVEAGSPYANWSGGLAFEGDGNKDGVTEGMAWLLGAATPFTNAITRLPVASQSSGNLVLNFTCLKVANRGTAVLKLQYSKDLGFNDAWTAHEVVVPDVAGPVGSVNFTIPSINPDSKLVNLQATIPASAASPGNKLFARLFGSITP